MPLEWKATAYHGYIKKDNFGFCLAVWWEKANKKLEMGHIFWFTFQCSQKPFCISMRMSKTTSLIFTLLTNALG